MKKILKCLCGVLFFVFGFNICVNAEHSNGLEDMENGAGTLTGSVVVAGVSAPVYNVSVYWDDLTFEWGYNEETSSFNWSPAAVCGSMYIADGEDFNKKVVDGLYTDETCGTNAYSYEEGNAYYHLRERESVFFGIEDFSEYGQVVPSVKWNATSDYSYVDAEFVVSDDVCVLIPSENVFEVAKKFGLYNDSSCSTKTDATTFQENAYYGIVRQERVLDTEEIPDSVRKSAAGEGEEVDGYLFESSAYNRNNYFVSFNLKNKTAPTKLPETGDTIGSITISFRAK